ncbi:hypothetical protein HG536_0B03710 [Torulaspora globosa]|uniref:Small ribosomal subunit protein uS7m n=1 Tax=Torulaspora globosa TaxID=48254 RepID=A0A7G3ZDC2_9SACH|nr:uncharacterized protein HG536_0B03710 [Torulaspora globosa]QLL31508.1 hypothetical protein HG536_0B03710 [Torulaspora globosa]
MFKLSGSRLQRPLAAVARMSRYNNCQMAVRPLPISRFQSTDTKTVDRNEFSDEKIDEWLDAIKSLRAEFSEHEFLPESSLAPPGQSRIDIIEDVMSQDRKFEPSAQQVEEWERLKDVPIPQRRDPVVQHVTNMIMRHGKKQRAEKILSRALYLVFCHLRQDPVQILKKALDDLAPLMMVRTFNTGVAKAAVIPVPLNQRQRNRIAWKWIVEGASKRASSDFSVRLGEELIAVFKGNSSGFDKRDQIHKTAIAHRAYIRLK